MALIAKQAGYEVSGSDMHEGEMTKYLTGQGITDIHIGQMKNQIAEVHSRKPIDWFVYTAALPKDNMDHPELTFCKENDIKTSKRDELLNKIISDKKLKLIAIAGTHGKTTTTAMAIWTLAQLGIKTSHSVGANLNFSDMGHYEPGSEYFVYECDEFARNFLAFKPFYSIISGIGWDHQEIYPTEQDYFNAFRDFLGQSQRGLVWREDLKKLGISESDERYTIADYEEPEIDRIRLDGLYNRRDGWLVVKAVSQIIGPKTEEVIAKINQFPGVGRRFEEIVPNLYSDDAHTPEKIIGCMSVAKEKLKPGQKLVVIYEPLTNRRMHYLGKAHRSVFEGTDFLYWLPSYLAREDPDLPLLTPTELIKNLDPSIQRIAIPMERDEKLRSAIEKRLQSGDLVVGVAGGGANSLDEWLRDTFQES